MKCDFCRKEGPTRLASKRYQACEECAKKADEASKLTLHGVPVRLVPEDSYELEVVHGDR